MAVAQAHGTRTDQLEVGETAFRAENSHFNVEVVKAGDGYSVCAASNGDEDRKLVSLEKTRNIIGSYKGNRFSMEDIKVNYLMPPFTPE